MMSVNQLLDQQTGQPAATENPHPSPGAEVSSWRGTEQTPRGALPRDPRGFLLPRGLLRATSARLPPPKQRCLSEAGILPRFQLSKTRARCPTAQRDPGTVCMEAASEPASSRLSPAGLPPFRTNPKSKLSPAFLTSGLQRGESTGRTLGSINVLETFYSLGSQRVIKDVTQEQPDGGDAQGRVGGRRAGLPCSPAHTLPQSPRGHQPQAFQILSLRIFTEASLCSYH